jgi:hypothetical protein
MLNVVCRFSPEAGRRVEKPQETFCRLCRCYVRWLTSVPMSPVAGQWPRGVWRPVPSGPRSVRSCKSRRFNEGKLHSVKVWNDPICWESEGFDHTDLGHRTDHPVSSVVWPLKKRHRHWIPRSGRVDYRIHLAGFPSCVGLARLWGLQEPAGCGRYPRRRPQRPRPISSQRRS